jgi:hypothetical protein
MFFTRRLSISSHAHFGWRQSGQHLHNGDSQIGQILVLSDLSRFAFSFSSLPSLSFWSDAISHSSTVTGVAVESGY